MRHATSDTAVLLSPVQITPEGLQANMQESRCARHDPGHGSLQEYSVRKGKWWEIFPSCMQFNLKAINVTLSFCIGLAQDKREGPQTTI